MKPIIFKINRLSLDVNSTEVMKLLDNKNVGEVSNISGYDPDLFSIHLVNTVSDHIYQYSLDEKHLSSRMDLFRDIFPNKSIVDLKDFNIFKYIGNSRIDGYPIFLISDDTIKSSRRDYIISELGLKDI